MQQYFIVISDKYNSGTRSSSFIIFLKSQADEKTFGFLKSIAGRFAFKPFFCFFQCSQSPTSLQLEFSYNYIIALKFMFVNMN